ncbi:MAG: helix-turn-helix transcriptional regulator [Bacteroidota bacterium]
MQVRFLFFLIGMLGMIVEGHGQYRLTGQINPGEGKTVYLSYISDYRKLSRIYSDQIIRKTEVDSLGRFRFEGINLPEGNRIYRLHTDGCETGSIEKTHILGVCDYNQSILFIAKNSDTLDFPKSMDGSSFCQITSTNPASNDIMEIEALIEAMIVDFNAFNSAAHTKIHSEKWFAALQDFATTGKEPLTALYVYDFLSDRRNETYPYYLKDLTSNPFYTDLLTRLQNRYPETDYALLYEKELAMDLKSGTTNPKGSFPWIGILGLALLISLSINLYLWMLKRQSAKDTKSKVSQKLTYQEKEVLERILQEKTNKEIAAELFISLSTVKTHINNLYKKLDVSKRADLKVLFEK